VKPTPANPKAPLHVVADHDAIYVTCRGASVLGKLAGILAMDDLVGGATVQNQEFEEVIDATVVPQRKDQSILEMLRASAGREMSRLKNRAVRRAVLGKPLGSDYLADPSALAKSKARLAHLCRLIVRDRQPHCAANGILLLIPLAGTDTPSEAQLAAQAVQEDLAVARREMKLDCPLITLLVDMEELPGFVDFMRRQSPKELGSRRGNGFPMSTRLSREEVLHQVRRSLNWVCTTYLQDSVYRAFQTETPAVKDVAPHLPGNSRLVLLLDEMNERAESVAGIVQQAIAPENAPLFRYAGFYFAATGAKGAQAFVAGIVQKMVKEQSSVSWTQAALAEDADCHRWAKFYQGLSAVLLLVCCGLIAALIYMR
jgi:IcmF-related N-terminal domain